MTNEMKINDIIHKFEITKQQTSATMKSFMPDGYIAKLPAREKKKVILMLQIITFFEYETIYSEPDINDIIAKRVYEYVMMRRYLVEYGLLGRKKDGSQYWKIADI